MSLGCAVPRRRSGAGSLARWKHSQSAEEQFPRNQNDRPVNLLTAAQIAIIGGLSALYIVYRLVTDALELMMEQVFATVIRTVRAVFHRLNRRKI